MNPKKSLHTIYERALETAVLRKEFNEVMGALNRLEELEKEHEKQKERYFFLKTNYDNIIKSSQAINVKTLENKNEELESKIQKMIKGLEKAIRENKLKSIEYRNKNEIQNSMIFNQICVVLETILNGVKDNDN